MSVVVKRLKSSSMEIYVKGAPEVMADICEKDSCALSACLSIRRRSQQKQSRKITTIC
jgi:magnesium-transporting ATPase (P-type)